MNAGSRLILYLVYILIVVSVTKTSNSFDTAQSSFPPSVNNFEWFKIPELLRNTIEYLNNKRYKDKSIFFFLSIIWSHRIAVIYIIFKLAKTVWLRTILLWKKTYSFNIRLLIHIKICTISLNEPFKSYILGSAI